MGILGVQRRVWAVSGAVLRFLSDNDGGTLPAGFRQHGVSHRIPSSFLFSSLPGAYNGDTPIAVLRLIRAVKSRIIHDRAKRDPGNDQQVGQQSGRLPVLVCALHIREFRHLVRRRRAEGTASGRAVGVRAAWDGSCTRFVL
jgi:hypothetical protein